MSGTHFRKWVVGIMSFNKNCGQVHTEKDIQNLCNTDIKFILSNPICAPNMEVTDTELKYIHES